MTCSIAHIKDGKITLGIDSQINRGSHQDTQVKMYHYEDVLHVYGSGNLSEISLFYKALVSFFRKDRAVSLSLIEEAYIRTVENKKKVTADPCESTIFVYAYDRLFIVYYDGYIDEYTRDDTVFIASGSGMDYAYGAYYMGGDVRQCLEAATKYDVNTGAPFSILTI